MTASLRVTVALVLQPVIHAVTTVTAQRVDENILEVPMTISAFGSSSLEELVIQDQGDLQNHIPGLQFGNETTQSGPNRTTMPLRPTSMVPTRWVCMA
jgi:hypothetical protein